MSYTQKRFADQQYDFPPPPEWLVWQECGTWDTKTRTHTYDGTGQVRHYSTLQKAKKQVSPYNKETFWHDWSIYKWDGTKYVQQFSGKRDEPKSGNHLFQIKVKRDDKGREYLVEDHEVNAAIESILRSA